MLDLFNESAAGIAITGFAHTELDITDNTITPENGDGIVIGTSARVSDNEVVNLARNTDTGIRLVPGLLQLMLTTVIVSGNRLQALLGDGIRIETRIATGRIEHNVLNAIQGNGIIMSAESLAGSGGAIGGEWTLLGKEGETVTIRLMSPECGDQEVKVELKAVQDVKKEEGK